MGFTHLTLEIRDSLQHAFDKFKYRGDLAELAETLHSSGMVSWFERVDETDIADENLFSMLADAAENDIEIVAIDESLSGRRFMGRDRKMAQRISSILATPSNKVIHWGTFSRLYRRPLDLQSKPLTLCEAMTTPELQALSVIAVDTTPEREAVNSLENLAFFPDELTGLIKPSENAAIGSLKAMSDKRCANGKCNLPYPCGCGKTENFSESQDILYGYWDFLWLARQRAVEIT